MPKISNKIKINPRISPELEREARRIAREEYGDDKKISAVVEAALTHYVAARQGGDKLQQVLSATEGALLNRVSDKFEKEFDGLIKRIGDLIAKQSFYGVYGALIAEELVKHIVPKQYKEIRNNRWSKAHEILEGHYQSAGGKEVAVMLKENQQLQAENETLKKQIEQLEARNAELSASKMEALDAERRAKDIEKYYERLIDLIAQKEEKQLIGNKYALPAPIKEIKRLYEEKFPKP
jgi:ABC-type phosphate transport system auxiliary subunit